MIYILPISISAILKFHKLLFYNNKLISCVSPEPKPTFKIFLKDIAQEDMTDTPTLDRAVDDHLQYYCH